MEFVQKQVEWARVQLDWLSRQSTAAQAFIGFAIGAGIAVIIAAAIVAVTA
jgi:dienelactone hydrolase